jgi:hypothetical protein
MKKLTAAVMLAAFTLVGCATPQSRPAPVKSQLTASQWEACSDKVERQASIAVNGICGSGGCASAEETIQQCGYMPDQSAEKRARNMKETGKIAFSHVAHARPGSVLHKKYAQLEREEKQQAQRRETQRRQVAYRKQGWRMTKVYDGGRYATIVAQANRKVKLRCVLKDAQGNPTAAQTWFVEPPAEEVVIRTHNHNWESASCTEQS